MFKEKSKMFLSVPITVKAKMNQRAPSEKIIKLIPCELLGEQNNFKRPNSSEVKREFEDDLSIFEETCHEFCAPTLKTNSGDFLPIIPLEKPSIKIKKFNKKIYKQFCSLPF